MAPSELAESSLNLLNDILEQACTKIDAPDLRTSFIYRHARNIATLADDVFELESLGRISASRIVVRSMIESLFSLVAAVKNPSFAAEKVVAEIEDELKRLKKIERASPSNEHADLKEAERMLTGFLAQMREMHSVCTHREWNAYQTAEEAQLGWHYLHQYFLFSKYVHSTTSGIISGEEQLSRGQTFQTALFVLLAAAGHVPQQIETDTPQAHLDEAARLMNLTIDLIESGAFQDTDPDESPPDAI